jgi:hypothetical protein
MDVCIYCQTRPATTVDHAPPKGLFAEPRPSNLITVPACDDCNKGFEKNDDYVLPIATEWLASETKDGAAVTQKRLRAINRPQARRRWKPFLEGLRVVEARTQSGIYLGRTFQMSLDGKRIAGTVNRIIRALYYHVTKTALPVAKVVESQPFAHYVQRHGQNPEAMRVIPLIRQSPSDVIGDGTFEYRYFCDHESFFSFWYLEFYGRLAFIGFTGELENDNADSTAKVSA